jgi:GGDEF domain-containing protein
MQLFLTQEVPDLGSLKEHHPTTGLMTRRETTPQMCRFSQTCMHQSRELSDFLLHSTELKDITLSQDNIWEH